MGDVLKFAIPGARPKGRLVRFGLSKRMAEILAATEEYEHNSYRPLPDMFEPTTSALERRGLLAYCGASRCRVTINTWYAGWVLTPAGRAALRRLRTYAP